MCVWCGYAARRCFWCDSFYILHASDEKQTESDNEISLNLYRDFQYCIGASVMGISSLNTRTICIRCRWMSVMQVRFDVGNEVLCYGYSLCLARVLNCR